MYHHETNESIETMFRQLINIRFFFKEKEKLFWYFFVHREIVDNHDENKFEEYFHIR